MGFSPQQVDSMSLWQFSAVVDGYNEAHGGKQNSTSASELNEIASALDDKPLVIRKK